MYNNVTKCAIFSSPDDTRLPAAVCSSCKTALYAYSRGSFSRSLPHTDYSIFGKGPVTRRASEQNWYIGPTCPCLICVIGKAKGGNLGPQQPLARQEGAAALPKAAPLCSKCLTEMRPGIKHHCTKGALLENVQRLVPRDVIGKAAQKVLPQPEPGPSSSHLSTAVVYGMKAAANVSNKAIRKIARAAQEELGATISPELEGKLREKDHRLDKFFEVIPMKFTGPQGSTTIPFVKVKNVSEFLLHVIYKRGLNPHDTFVKIGVDSGQQSLKVTMNVIQHEDPSSHRRQASAHRDSGVKKLLMIGLAERVVENYPNLHVIFRAINFADIKCVFATDYKVFKQFFHYRLYYYS